MSAQILDGKAVSQKIMEGLAARAEAVRSRTARPPILSIVTLGENSSSQAYLKARLKACQALGIEARQESLPRHCAEADLFGLIGRLAQEKQVDGILLEQPLPPHISMPALFNIFPQEKDVEGITPQNFGLLFSQKSLKEIEAAGVFIPCTAYAILRLLEETARPPQGLNAVVVGRSNIVGKPTAHLLSCLDATVTLCHSKTKNLEHHLRSADIVVSAVGKARWLKGEWIKPGAIVLDAGINQDGDKITGDVDFASASASASFISPVPGGVGPVTVAMLLANVVSSAERRSA